MNRYAVALTLTKTESGTMRIITVLNLNDAVNEDAARGRASREAQEKNPGFSILNAVVACTEGDLTTTSGTPGDPHE